MTSRLVKVDEDMFNELKRTKKMLQDDIRKELKMNIDVTLVETSKVLAGRLRGEKKFTIKQIRKNGKKKEIKFRI